MQAPAGESNPSVHSVAPYDEGAILGTDIVSYSMPSGVNGNRNAGDDCLRRRLRIRFQVQDENTPSE